VSRPQDSSLGQATAYPQCYDPGLLFPIPRAAQRAELGLGERLPFTGEDLWTAYELSWLDARGKPQVAMAEFRVPADSPCLIESKSWKLYLNSFANERMGSTAELVERLRADLSTAAGARLGVDLQLPQDWRLDHRPLPGECIDAQDIAVDCYGPPQPELLHADADALVEESLVSHLLKSNCPVTGQPDWASVQIAYAGPRIERAGLLRYLVSFRNHSDFHEHCVERIFVDLSARCAPTRLSVYARYTRRGGLDINPFRSSEAGAIAPGWREPRQ
jgi:7-cyano-7-deazaguanine reductase